MRIRPSLQSSPTWWDIAHYYLRRLLVQRQLRAFVVRCLQLRIGLPAGFERSSKSKAGQILAGNGIYVENDMLSESQCADIRDYLAHKPVRGLGSSSYAFLAAGTRPGHSQCFYAVEDVIDCPHVMELITSDQVVSLATEYLGCAPTLSCLGIHWSFPHDELGISQKFHRDSEDWKYLRCFVYLSDVDDSAGPHVFVLGSHREQLPTRLHFYGDDAIKDKYGAARIRRVLGRRGTFIAADTAGIHKGEAPVASPRLILTFTFSLLPIPSHAPKPVLNRHPRSMHNYVTRLYLRR